MSQQLTKERLDELTQCADISTAAYQDLIAWVQQEPGIEKFAPDDFWRMDPRNRRMVIYNAARSKRPHDNRSDEPPVQIESTKPCPICQGNTTKAIDVASLTDGFTFINKNLFPCFYRKGDTAETLAVPTDMLGEHASSPQGNHYLQWTSTVHANDWFNMGVDDLCVVMERIGAFERQLLFSSSGHMPSSSIWHGGSETFGFVSMMKNYGATVGGSLVHGHQQITHSNVMSRAAYDNWKFYKTHSTTFSKYMLQNTPKELRLRDFGDAELVVPYFMRRPMGAMLFLKDDNKSFVHEMTTKEREAIVTGISTTIRSYHRLLPAMGRETAYNILFHTGPGAGIYIEFLPHTQETGGMEQLGLWVCQDTPRGSADVLREYLPSF